MESIKALEKSSGIETSQSSWIGAETAGGKNINEAVSEKAMHSGWTLLNTIGKSQMITDTIFTNEQG